MKSILLSAAVMALAGTSFGQYSVSTGSNKYVLLEEATGTWCGFCPDGAQIIEEDIKTHYADSAYVNVISWHGPLASPYNEPLAVAGDPYCTINAYDSLGFPSAMIDRMPFGGHYSQNRGMWKSDVVSRRSATANFQVDMRSTYNPTTKVLKVTVAGKALAAMTGTYKINAYLIEDSITSAGANEQHSYMYDDASSWYHNLCSAPCPSYTCSDCAIIPTDKYAHMQVARAVLATAGIFGDTAFTNPAINTKDSVTFTYTVPSTYVANNLKVIGMVQKYGGNVYDRAIENSITAKVRLMPATAPTTGIANVYTPTEIMLVPNPATNNITVNGTLSAPGFTKITITDVIGKVISESEYNASGNDFSENISLSNFRNGVYFMNIANNGTSVTKQFVVAK